jgi:hypothetical protein
MKYKFENHSSELVDPTIIDLIWQDRFGASCMPVSAILQTPDGSKFWVELGVFEYGETYEDSDVMDWALNELEQYRA